MPRSVVLVPLTMDVLLRLLAGEVVGKLVVGETLLADVPDVAPPLNEAPPEVEAPPLLVPPPPVVAPP